jgi:ribosomal protein S10
MNRVLARLVPLLSPYTYRSILPVRFNRSDNRPQVVQSKSENAQTVCVIPDPVTNRGVIYEPTYLFETDLYPNYSLLAISIRGYDYIVLEGYFRYIQKLAKSLDLNISEAVPIPAKSSRVTILKPRSAQIDVEHHLNLYHRIVKLAKVKATIAPILFECIRLNIPEGVELKIDLPNAVDDEFRYVPDVELKQLQSELRAIDHEKEETQKAKDAKRAMRQKEKAQAMLLSILSPFNDETLPPTPDDSSDKDEKPK